MLKVVLSEVKDDGCIIGIEKYMREHSSIPSSVWTSRVQPSFQPHPVCHGGKDPDRSLPLLAGVSDHNWLRFPVHHRGVSRCHCPSHLPVGHHHGAGDLHHRNLSRKGTRSQTWQADYTALYHLDIKSDGFLKKNVFRLLVLKKEVRRWSSVITQWCHIMRDFPASWSEWLTCAKACCWTVRYANFGGGVKFTCDSCVHLKPRRKLCCIRVNVDDDSVTPLRGQTASDADIGHFGY